LIASIFFGYLMNVLTFQIYDFTDFYTKILRLNEHSEGFNPLSD